MNREPIPKLVVISENFYPSTGATAQLIFDLTESFCESGMNIYVITSTPGENDLRYPVVRYSAHFSKNTSILSKAISGANFFLRSACWILANVTKNDRVLVVSNPPFICITGLLAKLIKGIGYIFLFQDIFPRSAVIAGILPARGPLVLFWKSILGLSIKHSLKTVILSHAMKRRCAIEFKNVHKYVVIPNWSILPLSLRGERNPDDSANLHGTILPHRPLKLQYSGNFGRLHDVITILECARLLPPSVAHIEFVGGGAKEIQITTYKNRFSLENIIIRDYVKRDELRKSIDGCDVSLVSMTPGAEDTVAPSKLYGVLASGKPIILIASRTSSIANFLLQNECGVVVTPGDPNELAKHIQILSENRSLLTRMGEASRALSKSLGGLDSAAATYLALIGKGLTEKHESVIKDPKDTNLFGQSKHY